MRKVTENEIRGGGLFGNELITLDYLCDHVYSKYAKLLREIHHVDTQLRNRIEPNAHWRIQGYVDLDFFIEWCDSGRNVLNDCCITIYDNIVEIWSWTLPFISKFK